MAARLFSPNQEPVMHALRVIFAALWLAIATHAHSQALEQADPAAAASSETFLAEGDGMTLHVRLGQRRQVELFLPATGGRLAGTGFVNNRGGIGGFTGMLANGDAFGITGTGAERSLWIGDRTFRLRPMAAAQFGTPAPNQQSQHAGTATAAVASSTLAGMRLYTAKSGNGYSSERSYDLCSDGRVFMHRSELQLSQFGSGGGESTDQGQWRQSGHVLQLALQQGGSASLRLEPSEPGVVRLNDVSYSVSRSSRCR
jgi:predicted lipoprotein with Yx(FWY)xxD motif